MEKNSLKAVIFDLDGVITDSAKYHYLAWKELADELGIPFDEEYNEKLKGVSRMESLELILANGHGRVWSEEEKVRMAEKKNDNYKELIKQITPADLLPGIEEFLQELRDNGIRIALHLSAKMLRLSCINWNWRNTSTMWQMQRRWNMPNRFRTSSWQA